jgi:hypothetical protein
MWNLNNKFSKISLASAIFLNCFTTLQAGNSENMEKVLSIQSTTGAVVKKAVFPTKFSLVKKVVSGVALGTAYGVMAAAIVYHHQTIRNLMPNTSENSTQTIENADTKAHNIAAQLSHKLAEHLPHIPGFQTLVPAIFIGIPFLLCAKASLEEFSKAFYAIKNRNDIQLSLTFKK